MEMSRSTDLPCGYGFQFFSPPNFASNIFARRFGINGFRQTHRYSMERSSEYVRFILICMILFVLQLACLICF